jgi:hypothetical protein
MNDDTPAIHPGDARRPLVRDRGQLRDRMPGACDHDPLASLDAPEQAGEVGFRFVDVDGLGDGRSVT